MLHVVSKRHARIKPPQHNNRHQDLIFSHPSICQCKGCSSPTQAPGPEAPGPQCTTASASAMVYYSIQGHDAPGTSCHSQMWQLSEHRVGAAGASGLGRVPWQIVSTMGSPHRGHRGHFKAGAHCGWCDPADMDEGEVAVWRAGSGVRGGTPEVSTVTCCICTLTAVLMNPWLNFSSSLIGTRSIVTRDLHILQTVHDDDWLAPPEILGWRQLTVGGITGLMNFPAPMIMPVTFGKLLSGSPGAAPESRRAKAADSTSAVAAKSARSKRSRRHAAARSMRPKPSGAVSWRTMKAAMTERKDLVKEVGQEQ